MKWRMARAVIVGSAAIISVQLAFGAAGGDPKQLVPRPDRPAIAVAAGH